MRFNHLFSSFTNFSLQCMDYLLNQFFNMLFFYGNRVKETYNNYHKLPLHALHTAYSGPTVVYFNDKAFDPAHDLIGWTTDLHPYGYQGVGSNDNMTHSFNLDKFSKKDQEGLTKARSHYYHLCAIEYPFDGYGDLLSHRSGSGRGIQGTFGFYGKKNLEELAKASPLHQGFVLGIHSFDKAYFSEGKIKYRLVKIDLDKIDMRQIGLQHNFRNEIVHVYVKDNEVCHHPTSDGEHKVSIENWTDKDYENYLKILPNFASTVDWVIAASDVPQAMKGKKVINLLNNSEINLVEWQKKQEKIAKLPLEKHGMFALQRPRDYPDSYEESCGRKLKPALLFKI